MLRLTRRAYLHRQMSRLAEIEAAVGGRASNKSLASSSEGAAFAFSLLEPVREAQHRQVQY